METTQSRARLAQDAVYRWLAMRDHSRAELRNKLTRKGFDEDLTESTLDKFAVAGLIDDKEFAEKWVRSRHEHAGRGRTALVAELRAKGVDSELTLAAVSQISTDDERQRANELVHRKLARHNIETDPAERAKQTRRLVAMLARRGFNPSVALSVVRDALSD